MKGISVQPQFPLLLTELESMAKDPNSPDPAPVNPKELQWWEKKRIALPHSGYTPEQVVEYREARKAGMSSLKPRVPLGSKPRFKCPDTKPG